MIRFTLQTESIIAQLDDASLRQVPFAMSKALNTLGNDVQADERKGIESHFDLRRRDWNLRAIKIDKADRATKTSWKVRIQVDPRSSYLDKFEQEGVHEPFGGRNYLWIPNNQGVFRNRIIQAMNPLHPKNLNMHKVGNRVIGAERTFMIQGPKGPMVIQRLGSGKGTHYTERSINRLSLDSWGKKGAKGRLVKDRRAGTQVLYQLRERVKVPLKLEFVSTAGETVVRRGEIVFRSSLLEAMSTARGR